jgi:aspartokinase/homoserine dehydrogenase 1
MKVLKFGGSSVGTPECIRQVKQIINSQTEPSVIVVSAFQGVTDQLIRISILARDGNEEYKSILKDLEDRHYEAVSNLFRINQQSNILAGIKVLINELEEILYGVFLLRDLTPKTSDRILSFGERLSSFIISFFISETYLVEIQDLIKTNNDFGKAWVNFEKTNKLLADHFKTLKRKAIVPGFIGSTDDNEITTLGRGGSDYTAAIIAAAINASLLEIWTDVDGFMTADPRKVPKAYAIETLSYAEAMELSHFGAKVIYTPTIQPVLNKRIKILIKNTYDPEKKGTLIGASDRIHNQQMIKGISSIDDIDLITIQGSGLVGVTGISARLFTCLSGQKVNIILNTQASSEYSISFAVVPADAKKAVTAIHGEFIHEIDYLKSIRILHEKELSIIAIVGEKMRHTPGISAKLFRSLGHNGINVIAIAQGSSELNISVVISQHSLKKALNVIHEGFFLSHYKELHLYVIGVGTVGSSLLRQISVQQEKLLVNHRLKINLVGVANSRKMLINQEGIPADSWKDLLSQGARTNLDEFLNDIAVLNLRNGVLVDCTASEEVAATYRKAFQSYVSVVTANKIACSSAYDHYRELKSLSQTRGVRFLFETNVGAGLPVINTINDLMNSGDKILEIQAVLSGTLNYIFNTISEKISLSESIRQAKEKGYSEPDPRIDLSGTDVVRKLLILSREAGYRIEERDVSVVPFLPADCFSGSLDDFWIRVKAFDPDFEEQRKRLEQQGRKWRFVARMNLGKAEVKLLEVTPDHPFYALEGSNNIITITTERYKELPMIIKGYGAGAEVTAAGIFADIIRIANI